MAAGIRTSNLPLGVPDQLLGLETGGGGTRTVRAPLDALADAVRGIVLADPSGVAAVRSDLADEINTRQAADASIRADMAERIDGVGDNLNGRIDAEIRARERTFDALQQQVVSVRDAAAGQASAESNTRQQADAALRNDLDAANVRAGLRRTEFVSLASRPGDAPLRFAFVTDLSALAGPDQALPVLPDALLAFGDAGTVARVRGAGIVATRQAYPVEPGRAYAGRFAYQRRANPSDPSNDSVRAVLVWLDQARNALPGGITVIADDQTLLTVSGRIEVGCSFARSAGAGLLVAPAGARYVRLAIECFGLDGLTDVEVIDRIDTTEATLLDPVSAEAMARIAALESEDAGPRLLALEQQQQAPNSLTFATRTDAAAATVPATVTTIAVRGRDAPGDGRDGLFVKVGALAPGAEGFATQNGLRFQRVRIAQDLFDATLRSLVLAVVATEAPGIILAWLRGRPTDPTGIGAEQVWRNGTDSDGSTIALTGKGNV